MLQFGLIPTMNLAFKVIATAVKLTRAAGSTADEWVLVHARDVLPDSLAGHYDTVTIAIWLV